MMKTLFLTLFMGLTFLFAPETSTTVATPETADTTIETDLKKRRTIRIGVRFGRRSKNCRGFGICGAYVSSSNSQKGTRGTLVFNGKTLTYIYIRKSTVSESDKSRQFKEGTFVMEEDFKETLKMDGENILLHLKAGKYKVKEDKENFLLEVSG